MFRFLLSARSIAPLSWLLVPWLLLLGGGLNCFALEEETISFEKTVKPFLAKHCYDCHSGDEPEAKFDLQKLPADFSVDETANRWIDVMHSLQFGEMPPAEETQPNPIEKSNVIDWVFQKMDETNRYDAYRKKLLAPEYGNWVSHEKLFSGEIETAPFSPSRLWRLSPDIFKQKGLGSARSPFTYITGSTGIRDYSAMSSVDQSTVQMMLLSADQYFERRQRDADFKRIVGAQLAPSDEVLTNTIRVEFRRVVGRDATKEEQAKYLSFLKKNIEIGGNRDGLKTTVTALFLSPETIYRMEFGFGKEDEHGRRHLSPPEIAYAISYALTDRGPEHTAAIKQALEQGKLSTQEDVARVVRQVLDDELGTGNWAHRRLPRVMRFFEEFFGFHRAGTVFKDNQRKSQEGIPQWNTDIMIHDARMLIEYHLKQDKDVIAELLTTNRYFVAHPGDNQFAREFYEERVAEYTAAGYVEGKVAKKKEELDKHQKEWQLSDDERKRRLDEARKNAERKVTQVQTALKEGLNPHPSFPFSNRSRGLSDLIYIEPYNLPTNNQISLQRWKWPIEQPFDLPKNQRAGMLTHPTWLAAHSLNEGNDPIRRGIWVREKLLAGVIQDVPPDVDAMVPTDPHKTLRERLELLRAERCWSCHRKINPLGETFEIFDDWGRHRTEVYFDEDKQLVTRRDGHFERMLKDGKLTARKINSTGAITGSGDPKVDGEVTDAIEMLQRLGRSDRARQSVIRHLFRYLMGRNEMLSDSKTLIEAEKAYLEDGGSFKALVASLLSSDAFLYRR
jgi:hypothetical protein